MCMDEHTFYYQLLKFLKMYVKNVYVQKQTYYINIINNILLIVNHRFNKPFRNIYRLILNV